MSTRFEFPETRGVLTALEVHEAEAPASPERLYDVLLAMRIQLVGLMESVSEGKSVLRLSVCELDGARLKPPRRRAMLEELARLFAAARTPRRAA